MHDNEDVEIDVVAVSPAPSQSSYNSTQNEKKYFCQRCLNHDLQFPKERTQTRVQVCQLHV
ncbi:hypothetical protein OSTOST_03413 [Ostertagia ostertagi]